MVSYPVVIMVAAVDLTSPTARPIYLDTRVEPHALQDHRISHRMLGPCCLCPKLDIMKPDFIEAAIYKASEGECEGQYVAGCAKNECGYIGEFHYGLVRIPRWLVLTCDHPSTVGKTVPAQSNQVLCPPWCVCLESH